jgi:nucleotide-binding universal stress UspA family protein
MQVYKKILVAMDCSAVDDVIIEHVTALAQQNKAEVYLLHVVHSHTLDQDRTMRELAQENLLARCETMQEQGVTAHIVIKSGEPEDEILEEIENNDYDLVAMATHGHTFFGDMLYGSVSRTLKHRISTPLLLIGPSR